MNVQSKCYVCGQEVKHVDCPKCWSGHTRVGTIEFRWNGYVAKRADVAWCKTCDFVWIVGADGTYSPVCDECRRRHVGLSQTVSQSEVTAAAAA